MNILKKDRKIRLRNAIIGIMIVSITVLTPRISVYATGGDNYPEPWRSGGISQYVDTWRQYSRQCTSWAAWALHDRNKFEVPAIGSAGNWGVWAKNNGYKVDLNPGVGSIAWWEFSDTRRYGHVAWVKSLNIDGSVVIEEYNHSYPGRYEVRTVIRNNVSGYIHFKDIDVQDWPGVQGLKYKDLHLIKTGERIYGGEYILSQDGRYALVMQNDGDLALYSGKRRLWHAATAGNTGAFAQLQYDGNFVVYNTNNKPLWNTETRDIGRMAVQSDGNFVGYAADNKPSWHTHTAEIKPVVYVNSDRLTPGQRLYPGEFIRSTDKRYVALMQYDGNFVVYAPGYKVLWNSKTAGYSGAFAQLQHDGNFVVYSSSNKPLWHSHTNSTEASRLIMQNDGNFVLYPMSGSVQWATWTQGRLK